MPYLSLGNLLSLNLVSAFITFSTRLSPAAPPPTNVYLTNSSTKISISQSTNRPTPTPTPTSLYQRLSLPRNTVINPTPLPTTKPQPTTAPTPARPTPTPTKTPYPIPTIIPTATPKPSPLPTPTQTPTPIPTPTTAPSQDLNDITKAVNNYRQSHNLPPLAEAPEICAVAQIRATEADENFSHDGFVEGVKDLDYQKAAENLWQGQPFSLDRMIEGWDQSLGHRHNLQGDFNYGCGQRYGNTAAFIFINR